MSISPGNEMILRGFPQHFQLQDAAASISLLLPPAGFLLRNSQQLKKVCKVIGLQINPLAALSGFRLELELKIFVLSSRQKTSAG
ncbi:MAG: hypothetical protein K9G39_00440 [Chlorobium sp.]|uniref:hypothetical protein n=1 Tax=Chlorobium sp. TaxID=1095 RepID=UPI0025B7F92E|nr:hypothetical protein [Chlorobium sp.]MCF8382054.1 hypothetical protein [Chlorobium sp.]